MTDMTITFVLCMKPKNKEYLLFMIFDNYPKRFTKKLLDGVIEILDSHEVFEEVF